MDNNGGSRKFNKSTGSEKGRYLRHIVTYQALKIGVGNIARRKEPQLLWPSLQIKSVDKICIFCSDDTGVLVSILQNSAIGGSITLWQIKRMDSFVAVFAKYSTEATRKLGINEKPHADTATIRLTWANFAAYSNTAAKSSGSKSS